MKKFITAGRTITSIAIIVLGLLYIIRDINLLWLMQLMLSLLMALLAYNHFQQNKKCDIIFWLTVLVAIFCFALSFVMIQPFF